MQETIGGDDIVECLAATLGIDIAAHIGKFAQQVEAVEEDGQVLLGQTFGDACIPHQFVRVHRSFAVPSAAVHRQVCRHLHVPREFHLSTHTILIGA